MANPTGGSTMAPTTRASNKRHEWPVHRAAIADRARALADRLDRELPAGAVVLHDRSVPVSTHGIHHLVDHLVVAATGVWIIDVSAETGRVERRNVGGILRDDAHLIVGGHDRTSRTRAMGCQTDAVERILEPIGVEAVPLHRVLCFAGADWSRFARPFDVVDVLVCWPRKLVSMISDSGPFDSATIELVARHLDRELPATN